MDAHGLHALADDLGLEGGEGWLEAYADFGIGLFEERLAAEWLMDVCDWLAGRADRPARETILASFPARPAARDVRVC